MVNESKKHISSPVIPWPNSKTSSQAKATHTQRPGALCSEENALLVFRYSFLRSNDHNCLIGMSSGSLPFSLSAMLLESIVHGLMCCYGDLQLLQELLRKQMARLAQNYVNGKNDFCFIKALFSSGKQNQRFFFLPFCFVLFSFTKFHISE